MQWYRVLPWAGNLLLQMEIRDAKPHRRFRNNDLSVTDQRAAKTLKNLRVLG
jgi:hypothetical protein